jgi:hypothetical protein
VATVQKTYASGDGCNACVRMCIEASNYILEFPKGTSATERALLMNAMFQVREAPLQLLLLLQPAVALVPAQPAFCCSAQHHYCGAGSSAVQQRRQPGKASCCRHTPRASPPPPRAVPRLQVEYQLFETTGDE